MRAFKQALKDLRRWQQGWGRPHQSSPWQIMQDFRALSDRELVDEVDIHLEIYKTTRFRHGYTPESYLAWDHSPLELEARLGQREAQRRFGCKWSDLIEFLERKDGFF